MVMGVAVVSNNGRQYINELEPFWYLDFHNFIDGSGSATYDVDLSRYHINVTPVFWNYGDTPNFSVSGQTVNWSGLRRCTFYVWMANN